MTSASQLGIAAEALHQLAAIRATGLVDAPADPCSTTSNRSD